MWRRNNWKYFRWNAWQTTAIVVVLLLLTTKNKKNMKDLQITELILSVEMMRIVIAKMTFLDLGNSKAINKIEDALKEIEEVIKEHMPEYVPQDVNKFVCRK